MTDTTPSTDDSVSIHDNRVEDTGRGYRKTRVRTSNINIRILGTARDWLEGLVADHNPTTLSHVARVCFTVARRHEDEVRKLLREQS